MKRRLDFKALVALGIVPSWSSLNHRIRHDGFPPGELIGPNRRTWDEGAVEAWLASRPTGTKAPLRGICKAKAEARQTRLKAVQADPTTSPSLPTRHPRKVRQRSALAVGGAICG